VKTLAPHEIVVIVGKRGSGKSHTAKALCGEQVKAGQRIVAFDPHDEYSKLGRKSDAVTLGPLKQRFTLAEVIANPLLLDDPKLCAAVVPSGRGGAELAADFRDFWQLCEDTGGLIVVADEMGDYSAHAEETINHAATQGRHYGVPCVFVAQRLTQVPKTARTQCSTLIVGVQNDPEDLKQLEKITGRDDLAALVAALPRRKFITWSDER
jgi:DNA helicase HerA-like ATPase